VQTLDELLRYQNAVVKDGLHTHPNYWVEFIPALVRAYRWAGRHHEAKKVVQDMIRWGQYIQQEAAMGKS